MSSAAVSAVAIAKRVESWVDRWHATMSKISEVRWNTREIQIADFQPNFAGIELSFAARSWSRSWRA